jgi:hypothetical protein
MSQICCCTRACLLCWEPSQSELEMEGRQLVEEELLRYAEGCWSCALS